MPCAEDKQGLKNDDNESLEEDYDESVSDSDDEGSIDQEEECEERPSDGKVQFLTLLKENCIGKKAQ